MIEIRKPTQKPVVVIRAATGNELSNYEKRKLSGIEENAQENKIEVIRVNNQRLAIDPLNKEVNIDLGNLAFKSKVAPKDLTSDELFFISCSLNGNTSSAPEVSEPEDIPTLTPNPTPDEGPDASLPDVDYGNSGEQGEDVPSVSTELLAMLESIKNDISLLKQDMNQNASATKEALTNLAEEIPNVDIENYYTKSEITSAISSAISGIEIPSKISELENDTGYLTEQQDLSGYAKLTDLPDTEGLASEAFVAERLEAIKHPVPDLTNYYTKKEIDEAIATANAEQEAAFGDLVRKSEIAPEDISLENLFHIRCDIDDTLPDKSTPPGEPDLDDGIDEDIGSMPNNPVPGISADLMATIESLRADMATIKQIDFGAYATKESLANLAEEVSDINIPSKLSELENDSGYLTKQQDLSEYAKIEDLPNIEGLASEDYVARRLEAIEHPKPDLTNYYTKREIEAAIDAANEEQEDRFGDLVHKSDIDPTDISTDELFFISCALDDTLPDAPVAPPELPDPLPENNNNINNNTVNADLLATIEMLRAEIEALKKVDYSVYATKESLATAVEEFSSSIPSKLSELENDSGYLTEQQDLSGYAKLKDLPNITGLASEEYVAEQLAAIQHPESDLENYYTKTETDAAIKDANEDQEDDFGDLARKSEITPEDISGDEFFIIACELNDTN